MDENVLATGVNIMVLTAQAMIVLEAELTHDKHLRANACRYCQARPGDPCHTRAGQIRHVYSYHLARTQDNDCNCVGKMMPTGLPQPDRVWVMMDPDKLKEA